VSYGQDLSRELRGLGIRGRLRRRIVVEFEDHLRSDPEAELGSPAAIARQFADELGTRRALRAAGTTFLALAVAGIAAATAFIASGSAGLRLAQLHPRDEGVGAIAGLLTVLGAQVALASGSLAVLRALRRRRERTISHADAVVIGRRAAAGAIAGLVTMAGMVLFAEEFNHGMSSWWTTLVVVGAGAGSLALLASAPTLVAAARVRPLGDGEAGDVLTDLAPLVPPVLQRRPWRFALLFAGALAAAIAIAGVAAGDPYDGALRGLTDAGACLAGFGLLGRFLSLR
jgi:hypothetical protein